MSDAAFLAATCRSAQGAASVLSEALGADAAAAAGLQKESGSLANLHDTLQRLENTLKQLLDPSPEKKNAEGCVTGDKKPDDGRGSACASVRKSFRYSQRIPPVRGKTLPQSDEYIEVECNDISAGGISLFVRSPTGCEQIVVSFGQPPGTTCMLAQIVYIKEAERNGQRTYLVGCRFLERVQS